MEWILGAGQAGRGGAWKIALAVFLAGLAYTLPVTAMQIAGDVAPRGGDWAEVNSGPAGVLLQVVFFCSDRVKGSIDSENNA